MKILWPFFLCFTLFRFNSVLVILILLFFSHSWVSLCISWKKSSQHSLTPCPFHPSTKNFHREHLTPPLRTIIITSSFAIYPRDNPPFTPSDHASLADNRKYARRLFVHSFGSTYLNEETPDKDVFHYILSTLGCHHFKHFYKL